MRSTLLAALAVLAGSSVSLFSLVAGAASPPVRAIARQDARPWLFVGAAQLPATAPTETRARARAIVSVVVKGAAALELPVAEVARLNGGDSLVRFEQTHHGLPVIGRGASVRMNARGESVLSVANLETSLPASIHATIVADDAARAARPFTKLGVRASDAHLVIFPTREGARLAWAVVPQVIPGLPTAPRMMIDAQTGAVLESRETVVFKDTAKVYETNPTASPTLAVKPLRMATSGTGVLENPFIQSHNCVDQKTVKNVDFGGFPLSVHVCEMAQLASANEAGDFLYEPHDAPADAETRHDAFSEVSLYYHVSKAYEFFRGMAGDPELQVVADKPLRTISNLQIAHGLLQGNIGSAADPTTALDPFQNAFFSPAGGGLGQVFEQLYGFNAGAMWFGQGPVHDYSYDGDVVYHEFTHGVVDKTLQLGAWHLDGFGLIDAPGAMNEGLADYFSSALAGDPNVGEYASKDFSANLTSIRSLDNNDRCPDQVVGEVHFDSTLFSGGLWKARMTLSEADRPKFDAALYSAMRTHAGDGDLGYQDATKFFLESLKIDLPKGADALEAEMGARGVLPGCTRVFKFAGTPIAAAKGVTSPGAFAAPGKANVQGAALAPGMMQVSMDLPKGTTAVTVTFRSKAAAASPLGGGGTPFVPVVLAKLGKPLMWTTKGKVASDADVTAEATGDGAKTTQVYTARVPVPEGAESIYVQIANKGDSDGSYDQLNLATEGVVPTEEKPVPEEGKPSVDKGTPPAPAADTPPTTTTSSGCACSFPAQQSAPLGALMAGIGALAFLTRRRRRR